METLDCPNKIDTNLDGYIISVVIIDDHEIVRQGLMAMLRREDGLCLVGDASDAVTGLKLIDATNPDVVLLDIQLNNSDMDGFSLAKQIKSKSPDKIVIMLTGFDSALYLIESIRTRLDGFVLKEQSGAIIAGAIKMAYAGVGAWDTRILHRALVNRLKAHTGDTIDNLGNIKADIDLNDKERMVFNLLARGYSNKDIESTLKYTASTVKKYVYTCMKKFGVSNRTQLALIANSTGVK
ncbi:MULTISPECIES: response regulator transcription factor [Dehalococcoides]|jgi:Response regulator containing a CheY-like receiver domain and an HTH DNA-binding domain|uniref:LuxR family DNA-binding response regulator n=2 Tax=root TaxID=1 RepID=A0AB33HN74_9CHLR|nr:MULTISPECIES: response regulator transcription factor [Dehalococcoides]AQU02588.1 DNA-binding response regulator [Dehalococcoides mccartyi]AQU03924.1 DNA-binding response regulator [Dehalococcoides mccartyi]MEA4878662.1 response regulator transcription factor [Dehalococcoides mccartyi]BAZ96733.1 LuxR family DNA-binding response regulator [Dehalococcoides mccartyi]